MTTNQPNCSCGDFQKTHWPCKHMLAIIIYHPTCDWESLPEEYRENVDEIFLTLNFIKEETQNQETVEIQSTDIEETEQKKH